MQYMEPTTKETYQLINKRLDALEEKLKDGMPTSVALKTWEETLMAEIQAVREELAECKALYCRDWTGVKGDISYDIEFSGTVHQVIEIIVPDVSPTDIHNRLMAGEYLTTVMSDNKPQIIRHDGAVITPVANIISQTITTVDDLNIVSIGEMVLKDD